MAGRRPVEIELDVKSREGLQDLVRRHSSPQQLVKRAQIILQAGDGKNHSQVARELEISIDMARQWRNRWHSYHCIPLSELSICERLEDAPRPGRSCRITAEQVCQIVSLACEAPEKSGRPISQWSGRELADEVMERKIVEKISERHVQRLLKRGTFNPIASATG
jgi:putative transposase